MSRQRPDLLSIESIDGIHIVRCLTETLLDPMDIQQVDDELGEALSDVAKPRVIMDLGTVNHMASLMLSVLIKLHQDTAKKDGTLYLASIPPRLLGLFALVGLDKVFAQHDSVDDALAALKKA
jgi:anti-anti-sigma factor